MSLNGGYPTSVFLTPTPLFFALTGATLKQMFSPVNKRFPGHPQPLRTPRTPGEMEPKRSEGRLPTSWPHAWSLAPSGSILPARPTHGSRCGPPSSVAPQVKSHWAIGPWLASHPLLIAPESHPVPGCRLHGSIGLSVSGAARISPTVQRSSLAQSSSLKPFSR